MMRLEPGQRFRPGGDAEQLCGLLIDGFSCRSRTASGGRQILSIQMPGDFIGLEDVIARPMDRLEALGLADVLLIDTALLQRAMSESASIAKAIAVELQLQAFVVSEWLLNIGRRTALTRVAHLLAELGLRWEAAGLGHRDRFEMPLSQEQLSDCVGTTGPYTNKVLRSLEREGLIRRDRRRLHIVDWERLCQVGDFDGGYLHLERRR